MIHSRYAPIRFRFLFRPQHFHVGFFWTSTHIWQHYDSQGNKLVKSKKLSTTNVTVFITIIPMISFMISVDVQRVKSKILEFIKKENNGQ